MIHPFNLKCSIEDHHKSEAVGSTLLKTIIKQTPAHYFHAKTHREESTPAQAFGTAIHAAILEPSYYIDRMVVEPKFGGVGSKSAREEWHLMNHGKIILKPDQAQTIEGILKSISNHKQASKLIVEGHAEESLFWTDQETGVACKTRPDFKRENHIIINVKSTEDASTEACRKAIGTYSYHIQAAMELDGAEAVYGHKFDQYIYLFCEKSAPFGINCFSLGFESIAEGRALKNQGLEILGRCQKSGIYPAYDDSQIHPIGLPTWAFKQETL